MDDSFHDSAYPIAVHGNDAHRDRILPRAANGAPLTVSAMLWRPHRWVDLDTCSGIHVAVKREAAQRNISLAHYVAADATVRPALDRGLDNSRAEGLPLAM